MEPQPQATFTSNSVQVLTCGFWDTRSPEYFAWVVLVVVAGCRRSAAVAAGQAGARRTVELIDRCVQLGRIDRRRRRRRTAKVRLRPHRADPAAQHASRRVRGHRKTFSSAGLQCLERLEGRPTDSVRWVGSQRRSWRTVWIVYTVQPLRRSSSDSTNQSSSSRPETDHLPYRNILSPIFRRSIIIIISLL